MQQRQHSAAKDTIQKLREDQLLHISKSLLASSH